MISVVVLAYGDEPYLAGCLAAILDGAPAGLQVVLVDNGSPDVSGLQPDARVAVVGAGSNLGFAGGCNLGVSRARGDVVVLVNSDALVAPGAIEVLARAVADPAVGIATGSVRLADRPDTVNAAGNPVHFLGLVWAGGNGEPAARHGAGADVASASGAFLALRRAVWDDLGGFPETYFAYHEDAELSLRAWQRGYRVRYVPDAVAFHHYDFARNPAKQYLLERNRWLTVLTVFPARVLAAACLPLLAFEPPVFAVAAIQGWAGAKLRGWLWLITHAGWIRRRRGQVQRARVLPDPDFAALLTARIDTTVIGRAPGLGVLNAVLAGYWRLARAALGQWPSRNRAGRS